MKSYNDVLFLKKWWMKMNECLIVVIDFVNLFWRLFLQFVNRYYINNWYSRNLKNIDVHLMFNLWYWLICSTILKFVFWWILFDTSTFVINIFLKNLYNIKTNYVFCSLFVDLLNRVKSFCSIWFWKWRLKFSWLIWNFVYWINCRISNNLKIWMT